MAELRGRWVVVSCCLGALACSDAVEPGTESISTVSQPWEAESVREEAHNTHLWIVRRALALVAARPEPAAQRLVARMADESCRAQWEQGLTDADYLAAYNDGRRDSRPGDGTAETVAAGATWKSHFYDPDTELNYRGERAPTARTRAAQFVAQAVTEWHEQRRSSACYALGLSLHYATDATQPMHTVNFTATDRALFLHSNVERYAVTVQERFAVDDATRVDPTYPSPDAAFVAAAHTSKALWPTLRDAIYSAYRSRGFWCAVAYYTWTVDKPSCWQNDGEVDAQIGEALQTAQLSTAAYLMSVAPLVP